MERGKTGTSILDGSEKEETPSSSSSLIQSQVEAEADTDSGQGSKVKDTSVNDVPPEMFLEILKFVDTRTLFDCRLVNRQWSSAASGVLTTRADAKVCLKLEKKEKVSQEIGNQKSRVKSFLLCMEKSENCPFAHFVIFCKRHDLNYSEFFNHEDFKAFLKAYQNHRIQIKSLELSCWELSSSFKPLIEHLRDLLNKIPHLKELGLDLIEKYNVENKEMKLFPETTENSTSVIQVQLPRLTTIHLSSFITAARPQFLKDLLNSAINLNKLYFYPSNHRFSKKFYDFLQPLGKTPFLKAIELCGDFLSKVQKHPEVTRAVLDLQLEELELDPDFYLDKEAVRVDARNFISTLLESNKNCLKKLRLRSSRHLHDLQFPRFQNLTELKVKHYEKEDTFFARGVRSMDIFPAVRKLDLLGWSWDTAFSDLGSIPVFPRLEILRVSDVGFTPDSIQVLPLLCQDLKHLKIHRQTHDLSDRSPTINFEGVGRQIWTHLKTLESLEIDIDLDLPENCPSALDSCFTGISKKNCKRLCKMTKLQKTLKSLRFPGKTLKAKMTAEREHPSILDMTNLRTLKINPYSGEKLLDGNAFFTEKLTWISEEYAFKSLSHLKPKPKPLEF